MPARSETNQSHPEYYFDLASGQLLVGQSAYEYHVEAGGHPADIHELGSLLLKGSELRVPEPADVGIDWNRATAEEVVDNSRWIYSAVKRARQGSDGRTKDANHDIIVAINRLGLGPSLTRIYRYPDIDSLENYYDMLELENVHRVNQSWDGDSLVEHLREMGAKLGRRPKEKDLVALWQKDPAKYPHPETYQKAFGAFGAGLELAGYVSPKAARWTERTYLDWALRFRIVNGGTEIHYKALRSLSRVGVGPSESACVDNFGSLNGYRERSSKEYEMYLEQRRQMLEAVELSADQTPASLGLFANAETEDDLLRNYSKFLLVGEVFGDIDTRHQVKIAQLPAENLVNLAASKGIGKSDLEQLATTKGLYFFIWQPGITHPQLKLGESLSDEVSAGTSSPISIHSMRSKLPGVIRKDRETREADRRAEMQAKGQQIKQALDSGELPLQLLRGASSGTEIIKRYDRYKIAASLLPDTTHIDDLLKISIASQSSEEFAQRLRRSGVNVPSELAL